MFVVTVAIGVSISSVKSGKVGKVFLAGVSGIVVCGVVSVNVSKESDVAVVFIVPVGFVVVMSVTKMFVDRASGILVCGVLS